MRIARVGWMVPALMWAQGPAAPQPGNVTMPLAEYNRLVEAANKPAVKPAAPPHDYAIQTVDVALEVDKEAVTGSIRLRGEVFRKGPARVGLVTGMTVFDAKLTGSTAALPLEQVKGAHATVLEGPSEFGIQLEAGVPLTLEAGRAAFTIPAFSGGSVRLQLTAPGEQTGVQISPGVITSRSSAQGKTVVEAILEPGTPAVVSWSARMPSTQVEPRKEIRFLSDVHTLVTVAEDDLSITTLADITVIQGEAAEFALEIPPGFEVISATGATLERSETKPGRVVLWMRNPAERSHQVLVTLTRAEASSKVVTALPGFAGSQRETGEVLVEGLGAVELTVSETAPLRRMDQRELSGLLASMAEHSVQAVFRYQRRAAEMAKIELTATRFPNAKLGAALAPASTVTTLVTREGRSLTEVKLEVSNRTQQYLRVNLPAGASMVSAEVAGAKVKPVEAADGSRVPLLRPGFRPGEAPYAVSFVFVQPGTPFLKRGEGSLTLPRMDLPVQVMDWEVFLPEEFQIGTFGGDPVKWDLMPGSVPTVPIRLDGPPGITAPRSLRLLAGHVGGYLIDASGASIPNATVRVVNLDTRAERTVQTDTDGVWRAGPVQPGRLEIHASAQGFKSLQIPVGHTESAPTLLTLELALGAVSESIEVTTDARESSRDAERKRRNAASAPPPPPPPLKADVQDLQRRVAGVLPVGMQVPRVGTAYRFVRPLVIDEETRLAFQYRMGK